MWLKRIFLLLSVIVLALLAGYFFQDIKTGKGSDPEIRYELVKNWPQLPDRFTLGNAAGLGIDSNQDVFVFCRAGREWPLLGGLPDTYIQHNTILQLDHASGQIKHSWGANFFIMPHGLTVDRNDCVWVTDVDLHQVFKFTHEGVLLMTIGVAKTPGNDAAHFNKPTDVAVAPDGSFYVSDGYGNSRVVKFSATGKYLFEWGKKGTAPGEFDIPHSIALDAASNVVVADRENKRIQFFDASGTFLKQFAAGNTGNFCAVAFDKNGRLLAVDDVTYFKVKHRGSDVFIFDSALKVQNRFGRSGLYDGSRCWYHDVAVDREGNIYTGDILGNRIQKFGKLP
jgi:peptidylamidoglycolate lyase